MKPIECAKCHRHWNPKFNDKCPRCGAKEGVQKEGGGVTFEMLSKLEEHFNGH